MKALWAKRNWSLLSETKGIEACFVRQKKGIEVCFLSQKKGIEACFVRQKKGIEAQMEILKSSMWQNVIIVID